jgi:hypothetical protein
LGVVWFPLVVAIALIAGAVILSIGAMHGAFPDPKADPTAFLHALTHFGGVFGLCWLVFMIVGAMIQVGLLRKALGLHPGPVFIYFSLGAPVWRMIGAMLLLFVIFIGIALGEVAVGFIVYGLAHSFVAAPGSYWIVGIAVFFLFCFYFYAMVRVSYFVPVIVVAEGHIGIGRAWELARGSFWRIVAIMLVISLAVNIVASMISTAIAPSFMVSFGQQTDPAEVWRQFVAHMAAFGPLLGIVYFLQIVLLYGLHAGAAANAYRAVTSPPPPEGPQTA